MELSLGGYIDFQSGVRPGKEQRRHQVWGVGTGPVWEELRDGGGGREAGGILSPVVALSHLYLSEQEVGSH